MVFIYFFVFIDVGEGFVFDVSEGFFQGVGEF